MLKAPKRIAITGGAGQIAYQLLFRLAHGDLLGIDQPLIIKILEVPETLSALRGVEMEMRDCAFPLIQQIELTDDPYQAFQDVDIALLIGAKPRGPGMERKDLLHDNGKVFLQQGQALNEVAHQDAKVFVVGNPCNTNCLIAMTHAPRLNRRNFYAMTRLDQNRATYFLAEKAQVLIEDISHLCIWGNHSSTQVPDFIHAKIKGEKAENVISDINWLRQTFFDLVRKRGAQIIEARGKSSAASAAHALIEAVRDRLEKRSTHDWFSTGLLSDENPYGIKENLIFSFPCQLTDENEIAIVSGLINDEFLEKQLRITENELIEERDLISPLL